MVKVGIIADDLVGANTAAAPFRLRGLSVEVLFDWRAGENRSRADVVALDTGSRHTSLGEGILRAREAGRFLSGSQVLFKAIDSTLQGHLGAELSALQELYPERLIILAPAFPDYSRVVDFGKLLVNDRPLDEAGPDYNPTGLSASAVAEVVAYTSQLRSANVYLGMVRGGSAVLEGTFSSLLENKVQVAVCDSLTNSDLEAIAHVALKNPARYIIAGSPALARALVNHLEPHGEKGAPCLLVNGSLHPHALFQTEYLNFHWHIATVELDLDWVLHGGQGARMSEIARCLQETQTALMNGTDTILTCKVATERAGFTLPDATLVAQTVGSTFGEVVSALLSVQAIRKFPFSGLVLSGGTTAIQLLRKLGAKSLLAHSEVIPGMAAARLQGGDYDGLPIVTKTGNIGPDNALAECVRYLKRGLD